MNPLSNLWVYNHVPIDLDCGKDYVQRCSDKPDGLWVSVGRDWARWCEEERFRSRGGGLKVRHKVRLGKRDSILLLQSTADIVSFTNKYREVLYKTERDNPYCGASSGPLWPRTTTASSSPHTTGTVGTTPTRGGTTGGIARAAASGISRPSNPCGRCTSTGGQSHDPVSLATVDGRPRPRPRSPFSWGSWPGAAAHSQAEGLAVEVVRVIRVPVLRGLYCKLTSAQAGAGRGERKGGVMSTSIAMSMNTQKGTNQ